MKTPAPSAGFNWELAPLQLGAGRNARALGAFALSGLNVGPGFDLRGIRVPRWGRCKVDPGRLESIQFQISTVEMKTMLSF